MDIYYISASEVLRKIVKKEISCEEVMKAQLRRIEKIQPILNAFEQLLSSEEAIRLARQADQNIAKKTPLGRLHGLPVTVKDQYYVEGFITSWGNQALYESRKGKPVKDSTVAARFRKEGAIIIGMTNVPEMLICPESDNLVFGRSKNPYDLSRTPGGSSGGEGAAVASGCSYLGIGSDGGGSIRVPSHFSGIAGIKPSNRIVPDTGSGLGDDAGLLSYAVTAGPMARTVDDLILGLSVLAGPDEYDPHVVPIPLQSPSKVDLKELRVAFYTDDGNRTPTKETQDTVRKAAAALTEFVARVQEDRPKGLERTWPLLWEGVFLGGDGGDGCKEFLKQINSTKLSPLFQEFVARAEACKFSTMELRSRLKEIDKLRIQMLSFFQNYDVILCPVVATPAKLHGKGLKEIEDLTYTMTYNITGSPACVVRCGTTSDGLPIGVQIVAKRWRDDVALAVAKQLESIFGGWKPSPLKELQ